MVIWSYIHEAFVYYDCPLHIHQPKYYDCLIKHIGDLLCSKDILNQGHRYLTANLWVKEELVSKNGRALSTINLIKTQYKAKAIFFRYVASLARSACRCHRSTISG